MIKNNVYQIAIDGPSGAGKSSIAKAIAKKLNFVFINTGGMYRCYALALIRKDVNLNDIDAILNELKRNNVQLKGEKFFLNNEDVTNLILDNIVAAVASKIAVIPEVRDFCVENQQKIASGINCVMEGRDTTSVVLPNATLKVYLDADLDLRAKRRWLQNNKNEPLEVVKQKIINRDQQDMGRKYHPLIKTPDAYVIYDKDNWSIDHVADMIIKKFKERINE